MNETGDLPVQVRTSGDKNACESVRGLAMQFLGKVTEFAKSQELSMHSSYFDLKEGGQIFAQYGPAGRQLVEITMPEGGAPLKEQRDMFGPSDLPDTIIETGCDCKHVLISCGEIDWDTVSDITGRSGRKYQAMEGNYPHSYSLNLPAQPVFHYPIGPGDSPKISDLPGSCATYQDPGPKWGQQKAFLFTVCEDERDDKEGRFIPVMLPRKCKSCYYWELDNPLGDCDGQIYEGTDTPCGFSPSIIGKEEYDYRISHKKMKSSRMRGDEEIPSNSGEYSTDVDSDGSPHAPGADLTGKMQVSTLAEDAVPVEAVIKNLDYDPTAIDSSRLRGTKGSAVNIGDHLFTQAGYRAYYDLDCPEPDGTFVWYVPPKNEPRSRCVDKQTLTLRCASDDKIIQQIELTIIYNRERWTYHAMWTSASISNSLSVNETVDEPVGPVCDVTSTTTAQISIGYRETSHFGYVYAVDSDGAVHHIAVVGGYKCTGRPFGVEFPYVGRTSGGLAYYWNEESCGFQGRQVPSAPHDWNLGYRKANSYIPDDFLKCLGLTRGGYLYPRTASLTPTTHPPIGPYAVQGKNFWYADVYHSYSEGCSYDIEVDCGSLGHASEKGQSSASSTHDKKTDTLYVSVTNSWSLNGWSKAGSYSYSDGWSQVYERAGGVLGNIGIIISYPSLYATTAGASQYYANEESITDIKTDQSTDPSIFGYEYHHLQMPAFKAALRSWHAKGMEDDEPCE